MIWYTLGVVMIWWPPLPVPWSACILNRKNSSWKLLNQIIGVFPKCFHWIQLIQWQKYLSLKGLEPATSCVQDQDTTAVPARHMWETGSLNWAQFMLQWLIIFPKFAISPFFVTDKKFDQELYYYRCLFHYLLDVFRKAEEIVKWVVKLTNICSSVESSLENLKSITSPATLNYKSLQSNIN